MGFRSRNAVGGNRRGVGALKHLTVLFLLLATTVGCAKQPPMRIHTEANPRVDLSLYRTYEWTAPGATTRTGYVDDFAPAPTDTGPAGAGSWAAERADQQIRGRADQELAKLGYIRASKPQMLFSWHISTQHKQIQDTWGDFARYKAEGGAEGAGDAWIDGYEEGSLVIEARDSRNRALLWYATATAVVNPKLRDERIPEAVAEIFAQWPSRSAAR